MKNTVAKTKKKQSMDDIIFLWLCRLFVVFIVIITFYPVYFVLLASFSEPMYVNRGDFLVIPKGFTLVGYREVFKDARVWTGYANTILYTVCGTALGTIVTLFAGFSLSKKDLPFRNFFMMMYIFTMYFGGGMIPYYLVVKGLGMLNLRITLIILGSVSVYNIIVVRSFMASNIPDDLLDAATIDGCGIGRFFFQIVLPLSKAVIAVMVLYIAVSHWNSYFTAMLFITDSSKYPLQLFLREILMIGEAMNTEAELLMDPEAAEAVRMMVMVIKYSIIVVATVPILCVYPFIQKYFVKGVMIGSVKG